MLDLGHLPNWQKCDIQKFTTVSTVTNTQWLTWLKPRGTSMVHIICIGGGGGGGGGFTRAAAAAIEQAEAAQKAAAVAAKDTVKGLRTVTKYKITDHRALLNWIAKNAREDVTAFIEEWARKNHKTATADGLRVWQEKEAY